VGLMATLKHVQELAERGITPQASFDMAHFGNVLRDMGDADLEVMLDHEWPTVRAAAQAEAASRWLEARKMRGGVRA